MKIKTLKTVKDYKMPIEYIKRFHNTMTGFYFDCKVDKKVLIIDLEDYDWEYKLDLSELENLIKLLEECKKEIQSNIIEQNTEENNET